MGKRLTGFDYSLPFFYMVTIKRRAGLLAFSLINERGVVENAITQAFNKVIKNFHLKWFVVEPIWCYVIMPDHIHLLIKLAAGEKKMALGSIVFQLMKALTVAYWEATKTTSQTELAGAKQGMATGYDVAKQGMATERAGTKQGMAMGQVGARQCACVAEARSVGLRFPPVFERDWHDWIVKKDGQLDAFITYIRENPLRSWLRQSHREYFQRVSEIEFLGRKWYGYGNVAILKLPVLEPMRYSRKLVEDGAEWNVAVAHAERIGPGGAGVGTFMSPCEKACGHALGLAGGRWVVLSPEGFGERWHPGRQYERFCADGRMLFISLWQAMAREPTKAELYDRCHKMGDIVVEGLKCG